MVQMACLLQPRDARSQSGAEELTENGGARWTYGMRNLQPNQPTYQPLCCAMDSMSSNPPQGGPPLSGNTSRVARDPKRLGDPAGSANRLPSGRFADRFQLE